MATNRTFTKRIKDINDNKNKTDTMDDNNNDPTNNADKVENSLFNKTLFIEGCDCGVIATDEKLKTEYENFIEKNEDIFKMDSDDEDDDGQYLQLTYQTLKFDTSTNNSNSINNNNDYDNNNNNNSNNSNNNNNNKINSHSEEFEEESGYEKLLYYNNETIRSKSMESSTTHVYASLEETIAEYSTSSADWSDSNVYEYVLSLIHI